MAKRSTMIWRRPFFVVARSKTRWLDGAADKRSTGAGVAGGPASFRRRAFAMQRYPAPVRRTSVVFAAMLARAPVCALPRRCRTLNDSQNRLSVSEDCFEQIDPE
jgi:hypothetical protein